MHPKRILDVPNYLINPEMEFNLPYEKNSLGTYTIIPKTKSNSSITVTNKKRFPNGYVYLLKIENDSLYKIGVSQNVKRRIQDISSNLPYDLQILSIHYFEDVYDVEEHLAKKYKSSNARKEWYRLTIQQAKDIMIYLHNLNVVRNEIQNG